MWWLPRSNMHYLIHIKADNWWRLMNKLLKRKHTTVILYGGEEFHFSNLRAALLKVWDVGRANVKCIMQDGERIELGVEVWK